MKKLIAVAAMVLSTIAVAQQGADRWACQFAGTPYLDLIAGDWELRPPRAKKPFSLTFDDSGAMTFESWAQAGQVGGLKLGQKHLPKCVSVGEHMTTCSARHGISIYFDSSLSRGSYAVLGDRYSVVVEHFECTKG